MQFLDGGKLVDVGDLFVPGDSIKLCQNAIVDFFGAFVENRAGAVDEFFLRGGG